MILSNDSCFPMILACSDFSCEPLLWLTHSSPPPSHLLHPLPFPFSLSPPFVFSPTHHCCMCVTTTAVSPPLLSMYFRFSRPLVGASLPAFAVLCVSSAPSAILSSLTFLCLFFPGHCTLICFASPPPSVFPAANSNEVRPVHVLQQVLTHLFTRVLPRGDMPPELRPGRPLLVGDLTLIQVEHHCCRILSYPVVLDYAPKDGLLLCYLKAMHLFLIQRRPVVSTPLKGLCFDNSQLGSSRCVWLFFFLCCSEHGIIPHWLILPSCPSRYRKLIVLSLCSLPNSLFPILYSLCPLLYSLLCRPMSMSATGCVL